MSAPATLVFAVVALLLVACGGESDEARAPTTVATTTPSSEPVRTPASPTATQSCPETGSTCERALQLGRLLEGGDVPSIAALAVPADVTCRGDGRGLPLCADASVGEVRSGIGVVWRYSEGAVYNAPDYQGLIRAFRDLADSSQADLLGTGALRLLGVGCRDGAQPPRDCARPTVIFTAILRPASFPNFGVPGGRMILLFELGGASTGTVALVETWVGVVLKDELQGLLQGGTLFDLGRISPLP